MNTQIHYKYEQNIP